MRDKNFDVDLLKTLNDQPMPETPLTDDEFTRVLDEKGGFVLAPWDGTTETEIRIKELTKATIRCIPFDSMEEGGVDMLTGKPSQRRVLFARSY